MRTYIVRPGNTLAAIAGSMYGDRARWRLLASTNALVNPNQLRVGQILNVPDLPAGGDPVPGPFPPPAPPTDPAPSRFRRAERLTAQRLAVLWPVLGDLGTELIEQCAAAGVKLQVTQGLRTWSEQDELYAQGRTAPGPIVTRARGGSSYHNFGLAFDVVVLDRQALPVWDLAHPGWRVAADAGKSLGLTWGGDWKSFRDAPHFEPRGAPSLERCRRLYAQGLPAIWNLLGA